MRDLLLKVDQLGVLLFVIAGGLAIAGHLQKQYKLRQLGLMGMVILGPVTLGICWQLQTLFRANETLFWSKLMGGDASLPWGIGSLGLIAGSGLALGALAISDKGKRIYLGALFLACSWIVLYLHPTPHYVPMPDWADKLVWFILLVGGAGLCVFVYWKFQNFFQKLLTPIIFFAGIMAFVSTSMIAAHNLASDPIKLQPLNPSERIRAMGCLACHHMDGVGPMEPGGSLASVSSRNDDVLKAFLINPTAETAKELKIRENPTGDMEGLNLTEEQVELLIEAFKKLFEVKPPTMLGPGTEDVEKILTSQEYSCLSCHAVKDAGPPDGGLGGPLENAAKHSEETLVKWLMNPSPQNAKQLGIRENPIGAMAAFKLSEKEAATMAEWLITLEPKE